MELTQQQMHAVPNVSYDGIARWYQLLEFLAFGHGLEKARFSQIVALKDAKEVLLLGDGDGRFSHQLLRHNPQIRITSVELSPKMIATAQKRIPLHLHKQIHWVQTNALKFQPSQEQHYDSIVTQFFFDQFSPQEQGILLNQLIPALKPTGVWLYADFCPAQKNWRRQIWLKLLYAWFAQTCALKQTELYSPQKYFETANYQQQSQRLYAGGLFESIEYKRTNTIVDRSGHALARGRDLELNKTNSNIVQNHFQCHGCD